MSRSKKRVVADIEKTAGQWVFRLEDGLSPAEEAEFKAWQASDPRHAEAIAQHGGAWSVFDRPRQMGQAGQLVEKLATRAQHRRRQRVRCALAALIVVGLVGVIWPGRISSTQGARAPRAVLVNPQQRILTDGSVVELKADAQITVQYTLAQRRITLSRGEAHFQVKSHANRPFVVAAADVEFQAVGTAFSVELKSRKVELLVTEGSVAAQRSPGGTPLPETPSSAAAPATVSPAIGPPVLVGAGRRLVVELSSPPSLPAPVAITVATEEIDERLSWRAPRLEFTDTPLAKATAMMNEHNRLQFVIQDSALDPLPVSGLFRADRAEEFARLLEANFGVSAEVIGDRILLRRNR